MNKNLINPMVEIRDDHNNAQVASYFGLTTSYFYPDEIWVDIIIPGIQNWYMVSSYGRVYSKLRGTLLRQTWIGRDRDYLRVTLRTIDKGAKDFLVHRLVGMFILYNDDPVNKDQINHINGIKHDNHYTNLEWATQSRNVIHAYDTGLYARGEDCSYAVMTNEQVHIICQGLEKGISYYGIMRSIGESVYDKKLRRRIYEIHKGNNWKHISSQYDIYYI